MITIRKSNVSYLIFWFSIYDVLTYGCCMEPFIVGGVGASIKAFPHCVFLSAENLDHRFEWTCGSSVLNQQVLLTAAHCIVDCKTQQCALTAFAGSEDITKASVYRRVRNYLPHADYNPDTVMYDIGLVGLENPPLPLGETIKRVLIPINYEKVVTSGSLAGWGLVNDITFKETVILQMLKQKIHDGPFCSEQGLIDEESTFCAGLPEVDRPRPAMGDSGSAIMVNNYVQIGLVSFKPVNTSITIYTNTTYFYNWIRDSTKVLMCTF